MNKRIIFFLFFFVFTQYLKSQGGLLNDCPMFPLEWYQKYPVEKNSSISKFFLNKQVRFLWAETDKAGNYYYLFSHYFAYDFVLLETLQKMQNNDPDWVKDNVGTVELEYFFLIKWAKNGQDVELFSDYSYNQGNIGFTLQNQQIIFTYTQPNFFSKKMMAEIDSPFVAENLLQYGNLFNRQKIAILDLNGQVLNNYQFCLLPNPADNKKIAILLETSTKPPSEYDPRPDIRAILDYKVSHYSLQVEMLKIENKYYYFVRYYPILPETENLKDKLADFFPEADYFNLFP